LGSCGAVGTRAREGARLAASPTFARSSTQIHRELVISRQPPSSPPPTASEKSEQVRQERRRVQSNAAPREVEYAKYWGGENATCPHALRLRTCGGERTVCRAGVPSLALSGRPKMLIRAAAQQHSSSQRQRDSSRGKVRSCADAGPGANRAGRGREHRAVSCSERHHRGHEPPA
jgi:hypothetical protein